MTVRETAKLIGCTPRHVRVLIKNSKLKAKIVGSTPDYFGHYDIPLQEARRFASIPQSKGWPRGKPRHAKSQLVPAECHVTKVAVGVEIAPEKPLIRLGYHFFPPYNKY